MRLFLLHTLKIGLIVLSLVSMSHANPSAEISPESPWQLQTGMRYWLGGGTYTLDLFQGGNALASRLTYEDYTSNAAEGFWRLNHKNGFFLKGYLGGGSIQNGRLIDEDFPPGIIYSRTTSPQKNGAINYFSADVGYDVFHQSNWKAGAFIGYHYWLEHFNSFGCTQTAGGTVCTGVPIPSTVDALNDNLTWNSLRLGVNASASIAKHLSLNVDAAYIHSNLNANDFHNLRPSIRGMFMDGSGNGVQLDAIVDWDISQNLTMGVGGRWWYIVTNGLAHFEQTAGFGQPQGINLTQSSYGLLLQANYKFNEDIADKTLSKEPDNAFSWPGFYGGANIGYGTNPSYVYIAPASSAAQMIADDIPQSLNIQSMGFLGGGGIGYNWQIQQIILGVETDLDYAQVGGANATTLSNVGEYTTSVHKNISWLGTFRARVGQLASDNMLVYLTGGLGYGGTKLAFDARQINAPCATGLCATNSTTQTDTGWTAGGGVEYAVSQHIAFKTEYLYVDLGNSRINNSNFQVDSAFKNNIIRVGANYKI